MKSVDTEISSVPSLFGNAVWLGKALSPSPLPPLDFSPPHATGDSSLRNTGKRQCIWTRIGLAIGSDWIGGADKYYHPWWGKRGKVKKEGGGKGGSATAMVTGLDCAGLLFGVTREG